MGAEIIFPGKEEVCEFGKFGLFRLFPNSMQSSLTFFHTSRKF
jgi:hypothetical protein